MRDPARARSVQVPGSRGRPVRGRRRRLPARPIISGRCPRGSGAAPPGRAPRRRLAASSATVAVGSAVRTDAPGAVRARSRSPSPAAALRPPSVGRGGDLDDPPARDHRRPGRRAARPPRGSAWSAGSSCPSARRSRPGPRTAAGPPGRSRWSARRGTAARVGRGCRARRRAGGAGRRTAPGPLRRASRSRPTAAITSSGSRGVG